MPQIRLTDDLLHAWRNNAIAQQSRNVLPLVQDFPKQGLPTIGPVLEEFGEYIAETILVSSGYRTGVLRSGWGNCCRESNFLLWALRALELEIPYEFLYPLLSFTSNSSGTSGATIRRPHLGEASFVEFERVPSYLQRFQSLVVPISTLTAEQSSSGAVSENIPHYLVPPPRFIGVPLMLTQDHEGRELYFRTGLYNPTAVEPDRVPVPFFQPPSFYHAISAGASATYIECLKIDYPYWGDINFSTVEQVAEFFRPLIPGSPFRLDPLNVVDTLSARFRISSTILRGAQESPSPGVSSDPRPTTAAAPTNVAPRAVSPRHRRDDLAEASIRLNTPRSARRNTGGFPAGISSLNPEPESILTDSGGFPIPTSQPAVPPLVDARTYASQLLRAATTAGYTDAETP